MTAIRKQTGNDRRARHVGRAGAAARAFGVVASTGTSVPLITQAWSEQSICFAIPAETASLIVPALEEAFAREIEDNDIDRVVYQRSFHHHRRRGMFVIRPGVAGQVFSQLGNHNVNVLAIAQGLSEVSISLVVDASDTENAVKALHELIVNK
ncbi:MAG: ACT domain-containing protein [Anaerolineales bacterium]